jgi:hypothetical protein
MQKERTELKKCEVTVTAQRRCPRRYDLPKAAVLARWSEGFVNGKRLASWIPFFHAR